MHIVPNFLRSLLLTIILSFAMPIILVGGILALFFILSYIPLLEVISQTVLEQIINFLAIFGSGSVWEGILIIGFTCSLVGALFDTYAFYNYQNLHRN